MRPLIDEGPGALRPTICASTTSVHQTSPAVASIFDRSAKLSNFSATGPFRMGVLWSLVQVRSQSITQRPVHMLLNYSAHKLLPARGCSLRQIPCSFQMCVHLLAAALPSRPLALLILAPVCPQTLRHLFCLPFILVFLRIVVQPKRHALFLTLLLLPHLF